MAEELTFHLEEFEGPLELLLALVSKHKMDLHNIPILELIEMCIRDRGTGGPGCQPPAP